METVNETIQLDVPVSTAYNQWTQFQEFPKFMDGVESVRQIDDTHLQWVAEVGGERREWQAEIVEQVPDDRIAWRAAGGNGPNGVATFEPLGDEKTLLTIDMSYEPEGLKETLGAKIGMVARQVQQDLQCFKQLVEAFGEETGAWRGEVQSGQRRS